MTVWDYFLGGLAVCAGCTAVVAGLGRLIMRAAADTPAQRVHGLFVYWWMVAGTAVSGPLLPFAGPDPGAIPGWAMFCMLVGWLIGTIHGWLVLLWRRFRWRTPDAQRR